MQRIDGARLRALRIERGLTQEGLARLAGMSWGSMSRLERNERPARELTLGKLAAALGVGQGELLEGGDAPKAPEPEPQIVRMVGFDAGRAKFGEFTVTLGEVRRVVEAVEAGELEPDEGVGRIRELVGAK